MKQVFYLLVFLSILTSCGSVDVKDKDGPIKLISATTDNQVVGIGKIEPEGDIIQLSSPVNGIVQKILKKENDTVIKGTAILELEHQLEDAKIYQLNSEVNTQAEQINVDEAGIDEFSAKYKNAVSEVERMQRLLQKGAETQQAVDDATTNLKSFQSNLKRLQASVVVSKSKLLETKAGLRIAEVELEQKIIKAPINGKILEISTLIGSSIDTRQSFAQISPICKTIAVCEIDEMYADNVTVGQKAWVRNVGSTDTLSKGYVFFAFTFLKKKSLFTDQSGEKEDRRVRTVKIMLEQPDKLLLNARVECVIDISSSLKK